MVGESNFLRVSFITGGLGRGGAEKQFIYMLRALKSYRVRTQILTLSARNSHEDSLASLDLKPCFVGQGNPAIRLARIAGAISPFRPHFIQAVHFYTGAYAGAAGRLFGTTSIGAVRGDFHHDLLNVGKAGRWLLHLPSVFVANSENARSNALEIGLSPDRIFVLNNVIDLDEFDSRLSSPLAAPPGRIRAILVARLHPVKRIERFLKALALARKQVHELTGMIVGDGPELECLRSTARDLGLDPGSPGGGVAFLGEQTDIPQLLAQSDLFVLTSDREGFPNVILEAMAASLPVLSTPAGQARELVKDGVNGYLIPFDDVSALAERMVELARSTAARRAMGLEGRRIVVDQYSFSRLDENLFKLYREIAIQQSNRAALSALP